MSLLQPNADDSTQAPDCSRGICPTPGLGVPCVDGCLGDPDKMLTALVNTETQYGVKSKVKLKLPVLTGALGATEIARKDWQYFAAGAAIAGVTIVCGENVCGMDPGLELDARGKVKKAPDMAQRVEQYRRYYEGYGDMIVRMSVEDMRLGAAEYVVGKLGIECIELSWGTDGRTQIDSLGQALALQRRGYLVTPNPSVEANQAAFRDGALKHFEGYSRPGFIDHEGFMSEVERIHKLGAKRVALRTGVCRMSDLAMAVKWASDAELDLLTLDGVPTFSLQAATQDLCNTLAARGKFVPDIAIAGSFGSEEHLFEVLAMGSPFVKAVCMNQTLAVPAAIGKNIGLWLNEGAEALPRTVADYGRTAEEIFIGYEDLVARYGRDTVRSMPLGAIAFYAFAAKLKAGLQQLMAGSRNFRVSTITREDLIALAPEAAQVSGTPYILDACKAEAEKIINS